MDLISDILEPHSELIGKVAGTITSLQMLSGVFLLLDIRKKGSSEKFPVGPFLGGVVLSILGVKYASILNDNNMYNVNLLGLVVNAVYLSGFIYYTPDNLKTNVFTALGKCIGFSVLVLAYATFENKDVIEFRFGMILTGILLFLVGMPLLELPQIIKNKCTEGMPFPIILSGFAVSFAWMLYGFAIRNTVLILQNGVLAVIMGFQLSLFAMYPNTPPNSADKNKKQN